MTISIIGAGVSGLSCGVRLQERGLSTRILASRRSPQTTSDRAAAIWFPYQAEPADRVAAWCRASLAEFDRLCDIAEAGVSLVDFVRVYRKPTAAEPWMAAIPGRHRRCPASQLPAGFVDGVICRVPLIEVQRYMPWLEARYRALGGTIEVATVTDPGALGGMVVNCAGLGAAALFTDSRLYPIRGQILYARGWASQQAWSSDQDPDLLAYIIPRSDVCVLGGTAQAGREDTEATAADTAAIRERCAALVPGLADCDIVDAVVGLRPGRDAIRLSREVLPGGGVVVHNYGHGGAGFTLSWGCADEVAELVTGS